MEADGEAAVSRGRRPWDRQSVMDPYRDDPPARPVVDGDQESVENLEECDEPMDTNLAGPDSVCSCGECPIMQRVEEQKCCAEVPDWRQEYDHTGHCGIAYI
jgi:hypothetical protein